MSTVGADTGAAVVVVVVVDVVVVDVVVVVVPPEQFPPISVTAPDELIRNEYASPTPPDFNAIQLSPPFVGVDGYESYMISPIVINDKLDFNEI